MMGKCLAVYLEVSLYFIATFGITWTTTVHVTQENGIWNTYIMIKV